MHEIVQNTYISQECNVWLSHGMAITDVCTNDFIEWLLNSLQKNETKRENDFINVIGWKIDEKKRQEIRIKNKDAEISTHCSSMRGYTLCSIPKYNKGKNYSSMSINK